MRFITRRPIVPEAFFILKPNRSSGALSTFFGIVRDHNEGRRVKQLYYECYPSMADKEIGLIHDEAMARWKLTDVRILHRAGLLEIGDVAVAVSVASAHRAEAFEACAHIVDEVKSRVPIWKKEFYEDGIADWVLCRAHGAAV